MENKYSVYLGYGITEEFGDLLEAEMLAEAYSAEVLENRKCLEN